MLEPKGAPFRFKGTIDVEDCKTSREVMQKAGLDWTVEKCELFGAMNPNPTSGEHDYDNSFYYDNKLYGKCPNAFGTFRTDLNAMLGVVKERYTPVQNVDAFSFFDEAVGRNKAIWQTAGFFGRGERIFVSAKLPENIIVNGIDPVENYLVFTTSHDGSHGVKILFTPIRVVCQNTLNAAIQQAAKNKTNYFSFRHTNCVFDKIKEVSDFIAACDETTKNLREIYNMMYKIAVNDLKAEEIIAKTILTEEDINNVNNSGYTISHIFDRNYHAIEASKLSAKKINVLTDIRKYYHYGIGQKEILGTAWGVYNAITGYLSNLTNDTDTKRMDSLLWGEKAKKIQTAGELLLTM